MIYNFFVVQVASAVPKGKMSKVNGKRALVASALTAALAAKQATAQV